MNINKRIEMSNRAHKRLMNRFNPLHRNAQYHLSCIQQQNLKHKLLSKEDRKKLWIESGTTPY